MSTTSPELCGLHRYGIRRGRMKGRSVMERTQQLIQIAHPDVRDELRFYAQQQFYI